MISGRIKSVGLELGVSVVGFVVPAAGDDDSRRRRRRGHGGGGRLGPVGGDRRGRAHESCLGRGPHPGF